jgi:GAF domain-containing protein
MVATQAHESLGMLDIAIWLQDGNEGPLCLAAGQGPFSSRLAERAQPLNADEGVVGRALTERAPVWTPDVLNDPRIPLRPESRRWIEEIGGRSILAVPLAREHLMGALVVYRPLGERYSSREVEYLSAFANLVAVARVSTATSTSGPPACAAWPVWPRSCPPPSTWTRCCGPSRRRRPS